LVDSAEKERERERKNERTEKGGEAKLEGSRESVRISDQSRVVFVVASAPGEREEEERERG
jgi:hypothetical protein